MRVLCVREGVCERELELLREVYLGEVRGVLRNQ